MKIKLTPATVETEPAASWQESLFGGPGAESTLRQRPLFEGALAEKVARRAAAKRSHARWFAEMEGETDEDR